MENLILQEHLKGLEEKLLKTEIRKSPKELGKILGDDFFEFGKSGRIWYKKDLLENSLGEVKVKIRDFNIICLSLEVVLVTYRTIDKNTEQHTLRSSIWKFVNDRWQMIFHQGTPTETR